MYSTPNQTEEQPSNDSKPPKYNGTAQRLLLWLAGLMFILTGCPQEFLGEGLEKPSGAVRSCTGFLLIAFAMVIGAIQATQNEK